ncbi:MAG: hypothetical protein KDC34_11530 [Saprospiraceae bacterium]|nr:hypothetical protein [Saprospiraceae bacterium]
MKKTLGSILLFVFIVILISSCAPEAICAEDVATQKAYGFFGGLIHGVLLPFAVFGKMFGINTGIYAVNNTGLLYWLGYFIGIGTIGGGGAYGGSRRRRK